MSFPSSTALAGGRGDPALRRRGWIANASFIKLTGRHGYAKACRWRISGSKPVSRDSTKHSETGLTDNSLPNIHDPGEEWLPASTPSQGQHLIRRVSWRFRSPVRSTQVRREPRDGSSGDVGPSEMEFQTETGSALGATTGACWRAALSVCADFVVKQAERAAAKIKHPPKRG